MGYAVAVCQLGSHGYEIQASRIDVHDYSLPHFRVQLQAVLIIIIASSTSESSHHIEQQVYLKSFRDTSCSWREHLQLIATIVSGNNDWLPVMTEVLIDTFFQGRFLNVTAIHSYTVFENVPSTTASLYFTLFTTLFNQSPRPEFHQSTWNSQYPLNEFNCLHIPSHS